MMLGTSSEDEEYGFLHQLLKKLFGEKDGISNMAELQEHLTSQKVEEEDKPLARKVARQLGIFAELDFAQVFFDPTLPVELQLPGDRVLHRRYGTAEPRRTLWKRKRFEAEPG